MLLFPGRFGSLLFTLSNVIEKFFISRVFRFKLLPLTSMSLEPFPVVVVVAGTMGLLVGGAAGLEQCLGMLGETGSILTMAGAELRRTD